MVGEAICRANFIDGGDHSWKINEEDEFCAIERNSKGHCVAVVYSVANSVVGREIDDECASKIIESLIAIYDFEKVKWLATK
jgi:hypothetical protein